MQKFKTFTYLTLCFYKIKPIAVLNIATLGGATAIGHIAAVLSAMLGATVVGSRTSMGCATDGSTTFRCRSQVIVAMRRIAHVCFGGGFRRAMLRTDSAFSTGMQLAMLSAIMVRGGFVGIAMLRVGFGPCASRYQRKR